MPDCTTIGYLLASLALAYALASCHPRSSRYPPGPRGLPLLGNLLDMPRKHSWTKHQELSKTYRSDIIHYQVLGLHILALNSGRAVRDLLDKRSTIYSDRQETVMLHELTGWHRNWALMRYGDAWKERRRLFHQHFRPRVVSQYNLKQVKAARSLLHSLLESPRVFSEHIRFMASSLILDIVYALDVRPDDLEARRVERALETLAKISASVFMVDLIPVLKYLPSWFPGAGSKRQASIWKNIVDEMFETAYQVCKNSAQHEYVRPCFTTALLSEVSDPANMKEMDEIFMSLAGTTYIGGSDTINATLNTWMLAMTLFPHTQVAVQDELDTVLGRKRLPSIEDRDLLPRVTAMLHEVLRWHPVGPMGVPHRLTVDDEYRGYHIPAGTIVMINAWAILRDESVYPDPDVFRPERYLDSDGRLRTDMPYPVEGFGAGRRLCPGRHFAHDMLWLAIAHVLTVFRIERAVDEDGHEIVPEAKFEPWLISPPEPFQCQIKLRFPEAEGLIHLAAMDE
uniref:Cytochrome P450 n=1 Tax=Phanerodontia chrysosporium TaxID=2822231 RepID=G5EJR1_PHACH|nr:cytochrome P450 [Phanerodontia chrysosporium]